MAVGRDVAWGVKIRWGSVHNEDKDNEDSGDDEEEVEEKEDGDYSQWSPAGRPRCVLGRDVACSVKIRWGSVHNEDKDDEDSDDEEEVEVEEDVAWSSKIIMVRISP